MKDEGRARALSRLFGLALCAALAACGATPQAPRAPQRVGPAAPAPTTPAPLPTAVAAAPAPLPTAPAPAPDPTALAAGLGAGQTLTLAVGETASLGVEGASVSFDRVVEDSRCPANAQCIWQGRTRCASPTSSPTPRPPTASPGTPTCSP